MNPGAKWVRNHSECLQKFMRTRARRASERASVRPTERELAAAQGRGPRYHRLYTCARPRRDATQTSARYAMYGSVESTEGCPEERSDGPLPEVHREGERVSLLSHNQLQQQGHNVPITGQAMQRDGLAPLRVKRAEPLSSPDGEVLTVGDGPVEAGLVPSCCEGAAPWWLRVFSWLLITVVLPWFVLIPVAEGIEDVQQKNIIEYCAYGLCVLGTLYLLSALVPIILSGIMVPPPPGGAANRPLHNVDVQEPPRVIRNVSVIVNPCGGLRQGLALYEEAAAVLRDEFNVTVTKLETEYAGHARVYAREMDLSNVDALCVVGGDGSFHEVVNGMLSRADGEVVPLGLLPGGSGNCVNRDLGSPGIQEAARRVGRGHVAMIDVNRVTTIDKSVCSVQVIGLGLVGDVGVIAEDFRCLGPSRYDAVGVFTVLKRTATVMSLDVELHNGERIKIENEHVVTVFINQSQHMGKALRAAPVACIDDGLMDLCLMKKGTRVDMLKIFNWLPTGGHFGFDKLQFEKARSVTIKLGAGKGVFNVDGEVLRHDGTISIECVQKCVPLLCPSDVMIGGLAA